MKERHSDDKKPRFRIPKVERPPEPASVVKSSAQAFRSSTHNPVAMRFKREPKSVAASGETPPRGKKRRLTLKQLREIEEKNAKVRGKVAGSAARVVLKRRDADTWWQEENETEYDFANDPMRGDDEGNFDQEDDVDDDDEDFETSY